MNDDSTDGPFPRIVFMHAWGWEVIMSSPTRFRLISDYHNFGYIGAFASKEAAINYMNAEFL